MGGLGRGYSAGRSSARQEDKIDAQQKEYKVVIAGLGGVREYGEDTCIDRAFKPLGNGGLGMKDAGWRRVRETYL